MKLYIAGPMTNWPQFNVPAFDTAAKDLRSQGISIVSPAELDDPAVREACLASKTGNPADLPGEFSYGDTLGRDIAVVLDEVDGVATLGNWYKSRGARLEVTAARLWGKPVYMYMSDGSLTLLDDEVLNTLCKPDRQEKPQQPAARPDVAGTDQDTIWAPTPGERLSEPRGGYVVDHDPGTPHASREVRVTSDTGGQKGKKPERLALIPQEPLWELGRVYGFGAEKYDDHNYLKGYDWSLSMDAGMRHFSQFVNGEDHDSESGLHHLAHAAWHCFALMMFQRHDLGTDTRLSALTELTPHTIERSGRSEEART